MKINYRETCIAFPLCFIFFHGSSQVSVLSQHNDLNRTGWNNAETILHVKNVNPQQFGKLFTRDVDDQVYAQPLLASHVFIRNGFHNIVYVATVNNSIYAFDADLVNQPAPYWQINITAPGKRPVLASDMNGACGGANYTNFTTHMGIVGTPVIDTVTKTLFVVARSVNAVGGTGFVQYLHAIDITTGAEKLHSPVVISAQVSGTGNGSSNGVLLFDSRHENQRPGLLLINGTVYIGYASHCDWDPYHGWLLGYDAATLQQTAVFNTSPDGAEAGIWMSGAAPAADSAGNIYIASGNGSFDANSANPNWGESMLKLSRTGNSLSVASYFTPFYFDSLNAGDLDMGVIQVLLIPHSPFAVSGDKSGELFLVNRDNMGGFDPQQNNVIQRLDLGPGSNLHASLGYYKGASKEFLYAWSENAPLYAYPFNRNSSSFDVASRLKGPTGPSLQNGAFLATSSNGSDDSTAILWASYAAAGDAESEVTPGVLHAFLAADINRELWNSSMDPADQVGNYAKFVCPTVANGKVYMASFSNQLVVYGLVNKKTAACSLTNIALNRPATASSVEGNNLLPAAAVDGSLATRWSSQFSDQQNIDVDLGQPFDICKVILRWESALGKDFTIRVSADGNNWRTVQTISGNTNIINALPMQTTARYVRMQGIHRGTVYGYSLYELEVYGKPHTNPNTTGVPLLYPNPATDHITIWKGNEDITYVVIHDMSGKMMTKNLNDGSEKMDIPVLQFSRGVYIVTIGTTNHTYRIKLVH